MFTCAVYRKNQTKTFLICTEYKGKDKFSNGVFLEHLYDKELTHDHDDNFKEVIWSDGPTGEFKNKYMRQFIEKLSMKYSKPFTWKFSATSYGKGVVDGIGGKVKSSVRRKVMSQGKNVLIVQDAESFADAAKKVTARTKIIYIGEQEVTAYKQSGPFETAVDVKGISKMHIIEVDGEKSSLWENCAFKAKSQPANIILMNNYILNVTSERDDNSDETVDNEAADNSNSPALQPVSHLDITIGMWVIVLYEGEKWLAKVMNKHENQVLVRCLEKPFGINQPQNLEREDDAFIVEEVYYPNVIPTLTQIGPDGKKGRKWFWQY